jgi:hypothetical protein
MRLYPQVTATLPDGTVRSWVAGAEETIRASEASIRTALAEARAANGTDLRIAFLEPDTGRMRMRIRVREQMP